MPSTMFAGFQTLGDVSLPLGSRRSALGLLSLLLLSGLLVGCGSGPLIVYPSSTQGSSVQHSTRQGYTLLQSNKGSATVTVSLRGATNSFVHSYVSVANKGSSPITVRPEDIRVVALGDREQTFSAYAPTEVPGLVRRSARSASSSFVGLDRASVSSTAVRNAEEQSGAESSGYGRSEPQTNNSYMDLMLQAQPVTPQGLASGFVYTPFNRSVENFRLEIPVGDQVHSFRFTVRTAEE